MTKYNEAPDTSSRKSTLPPLPSLQEPLPVIGADTAAPKPKPVSRLSRHNGPHPNRYAGINEGRGRGPMAIAAASPQSAEPTGCDRSVRQKP
jgi:hypothetical protein